MAPKVLLVDNYDSFVYNLVQELGELGAEPVVHRNDAIDIDGIRSLRPDCIVISPGPGRPARRQLLTASDSYSGGEIEKVLEQFRARCREHGLGVELHPFCW